jgi:hypothetical protein
MLDSPLATLSAHASLAKKILAPHDTITASVLTSSGAHGVFHMTFGAPDPSTGNALGGNQYSVVGAEGYITVVNTSVDGRPVNRVTLKRVPKKQHDTQEVAEDKTEEFGSRGVEIEIASWLGAIEGKDDGQGLGDPRNALQDVAFIEACLRSEGRSVDLTKLAATGEIA